MSTDEELFATIAGAGDGNDYEDRFLDGEHIVALNNCERKKTQDHGEIVAVDFVVMQSTAADYVGKGASEAYFVQKSDKEGGLGAKQRAFALAKAIVQSLGADPDDLTPVIDANGQVRMLPGGKVLTKGLAIVMNTLSELTRKDQPWRGVMLRATGKKKIGKTSKKEYVAVKYSPIVQTVPQIHAARAKIEAAEKQAAPIAAAPTPTLIQTTVAPAPVQALTPTTTSLLG